MGRRSDGYLKVTRRQAEQLSQALRFARQQQAGEGPFNGRVAEQQDTPAALHHVRLYVQKDTNTGRAGFYTTMGEMAGGSWAGDAADALGGVSGALGTAGLVAGLAGPPGWAGTAALETGAAELQAAAAAAGRPERLHLGDGQDSDGY